MTVEQERLTGLPRADRGEGEHLWRTSVFLLSSSPGLAHGVSDCAAGFLIGGLALGGSTTQAGWLAIGYNGLAFGLQPLTGWLVDRTRRYREMLLAVLALSVVALVLFGLGPALAIGLVGLGSAAHHAAGGGLAIQATPGRAAGPGWFTAPGVLGLASTLLGLVLLWLVPALGLLGIAIAWALSVLIEWLVLTRLRRDEKLFWDRSMTPGIKNFPIAFPTN